MRRTGWRTLVASIAAALLFVRGAQAADVEGYRITSEAELRERAPAAIEAFWQADGRRGTFKGVGDREIAFVTFRQPDAAREKGAVVISAGRTEAYVKYKELVFDLWSNGYSVYIHDHRGQGLSEREPETADNRHKGYVTDFASYVADLHTFVQQEVAKGKHARHYLLAHSLGGAIASLYLEEHPDSPFRAAAMSAPMHEIRGAFGLSGDIFTCHVARVLGAIGLGRRYTFGSGDYAPKDFEDNHYTRSAIRYQRLLAAYEAEPRVQLGGATHAWYARACRAAKQARTTAARITIPVRVFQAGADTIVHPDGQATFCVNVAKTQAGGCGGDGGGPIVVPDARHELFIERDEARTPVLVTIFKFFDSLR